jgi:NADP-dependent 3-hydroxy acid dehydrogenase YdfG
MGKLDGRVALITGASRGIGAAVAHQFAAEGAHVALASRSGDDLGIDGAVAQVCDVRDLAQLGRLDIIVANAGVGSYGRFEDLSLDAIDEMIDVNLKGTIYAIRAALPHLKQSDVGDIVTLSSEAGRRGFPNETVYCASKFGQVGFTRALDGELRELGIRCTNVCPGGVATDFALGRGRAHEDIDGMMTADDVAELVTFVVTRPRNLRILETALRPMKEASWG